jgi:hypothetical protein
VRIEKRSIDSREELNSLTLEALTGEIGDLALIEDLPAQGEAMETGLIAGDSKGRVFIVVAGAGSGDSLVALYAKHLERMKANLATLAQRYPKFDWSGEPGCLMLASSFSGHTLLLASMLSVTPKRAYTIKCLGIGAEKGLYMEEVELPEVRLKAEYVKPEVSLLSETVDKILAVADGLSVTASFGYMSSSLDWVPVANLNRKRGKIWIESGPGIWSIKRVADGKSLEAVIERVKESYDEAIKKKGEPRDTDSENLSEAERKSLSMD